MYADLSWYTQKAASLLTLISLPCRINWFVELADVELYELHYIMGLKRVGYTYWNSVLAWHNFNIVPQREDSSEATRGSLSPTPPHFMFKPIKDKLNHHSDEEEDTVTQQQHQAVDDKVSIYFNLHFTFSMRFPHYDKSQWYFHRFLDS